MIPEKKRKRTNRKTGSRVIRVPITSSPSTSDLIVMIDDLRNEIALLRSLIPGGEKTIAEVIANDRRRETARKDTKYRSVPLNEDEAG